MFRIVRESFKITNSNMILATPLIFFSIISSLYLVFSSGGNKIGLFFSVVLFFLMLGAFLSGWFMMIKETVKNPDIEDTKLLAEFPAGVGEYFLSIIIMVIKIIIVSLFFILVAFLFGKKLIGDAGISYVQLAEATTNIETMKAFISSLSEEQLIKLNAWNTLLFFTMLFNYFILLFYPSTIFFIEKNPFKAFFISLKKTFGHKFFKNLLLFIIIFVFYMVISFLTAILAKNIIVHFFVTLINFYYTTFVSVLIFNYYYSNFAKIGSNIDTKV